MRARMAGDWWKDRLRGLASHEMSPRGRRIAWGVALAIFLIALVASYRATPALALDWRWLVITAICSPGIMLLNGLEYRVAGWLLGERIPLPEAIRIAILSTAANMLPIPGAVLVRSHGLRRRGQRIGPALGSTIAIGVGWVGVAFLLAGLMQLAANRHTVGLLFTVIGLGTLASMAALIGAVSVRVPEAALRIATLEAAFVLASGFRLYAAMRGIGIDASYIQSVGLTVAGAVASAVGVLPGGLGLRELLAGAIGPLIELPPSAGILGASVERLIALSMLCLAAAAVLILHGRSRERRTAERGEVGG